MRKLHRVETNIATFVVSSAANAKTQAMTRGSVLFIVVHSQEPRTRERSQVKCGVEKSCTRLVGDLHHEESLYHGSTPSYFIALALTKLQSTGCLSHGFRIKPLKTQGQKEHFVFADHPAAAATAQ